MLTRLAHQRAELVRLAQLPQQPDVEHRHRDDRYDVVEEREQYDAVKDRVVSIQQQLRVEVPAVLHAVVELEEAR